MSNKRKTWVTTEEIGQMFAPYVNQKSVIDFLKGKGLILILENGAPQFADKRIRELGLEVEGLFTPDYFELEESLVNELIPELRKIHDDWQAQDCMEAEWLSIECDRQHISKLLAELSSYIENNFKDKEERLKKLGYK